MTSRRYSIRRVDPIWDFREYDRGDWSPGRPLWVRVLWALISRVVFESGGVPFYRVKCFLLRCFGATVGERVVIKPNVRIKFPWRLIVADDVWIGQDVWIDNLETVSIGSQCCLSQGVYLCTGSHEFRRSDFRLQCRAIHLDHHVWVCAQAILLPGVKIPAGSLVGAGEVVSPQEIDPGEKSIDSRHSSHSSSA